MKEDPSIEFSSKQDLVRMNSQVNGEGSSVSGFTKVIIIIGFVALLALSIAFIALYAKEKSKKPEPVSGGSTGSQKLKTTKGPVVTKPPVKTNPKMSTDPKMTPTKQVPIGKIDPGKVLVAARK